MSKIEHFRPVIFEYEEIDQIPEGKIPTMIDASDKKVFFKTADKNSPKYIIVNYDDSIINDSNSDLLKLIFGKRY